MSLNSPIRAISAQLALVAMIAITMLPPKGCAQEYVNAQVPLHSVVLDSQGKLLAWYHPERNLGYDHVLRLGWDFIEHKVPRDKRHGLEIYLINSVMNPNTLQGDNWQHDPAMVFATFVDSLVGWYAYSGDEEAVRTVRGMLDYQLANGTTPSDWDWPGVPFATSCGNDPKYGRCFSDMPREFYGGIETDKVGELGTGYVLFYELTGERKYLEAAIQCAQALARHVRAGDDEHTPWPYRVDARTGATLALEEYGGDIAGPLRLFDELIRLHAGDVQAYAKARQTAWKWALDYPLNGSCIHSCRSSSAWNKWSGFYEDVPRNTNNVNQYTPMMMAYYILDRDDPAEVDPDWKAHVGWLLDWVRVKLGRGPFYGAYGIDEQGPPDALLGCCSRAGLGSDTARWAAINAMYFEKTRDGQAREDAFRSLNYATYFAASDGRVSCCGGDYDFPYWFSDGYADYLRHFQWAMGAIPEFAPQGQDHVLHSSSVLRKVEYSAHRRVRYQTFDVAATEVLRLSFKPSRVTAGTTMLHEQADIHEPGYTLRSARDGDWIVRIHHVSSGTVDIQH